MTAAGRKTAASLTTADRILVIRQTAADAGITGTEGELTPSPRKTGDDVLTLRVLEVRKAVNAPYRRTTEIVTTEGSIFAVGHQTFPLAPETPAAFKRDHAAALAEDAQRTKTTAEAGLAAVREDLAAFEIDHPEAVGGVERVHAYITAAASSLELADYYSSSYWATEARRELAESAAEANVPKAERDVADSEGQAASWFQRHAELGTDASRDAYPSIAYRRADEVEAYRIADDMAAADREAALAAWGKLPAGRVPAEVPALFGQGRYAEARAAAEAFWPTDAEPGRSAALRSVHYIASTAAEPVCGDRTGSVTMNPRNVGCLVCLGSLPTEAAPRPIAYHPAAQRHAVGPEVAARRIALAAASPEAYEDAQPDVRAAVDALADAAGDYGIAPWLAASAAGFEPVRFAPPRGSVLAAERDGDTRRMATALAQLSAGPEGPEFDPEYPPSVRREYTRWFTI